MELGLYSIEVSKNEKTLPEYLKDPMPKLQNGAEFRTFQNNRYLFCAISGKLYLSGSNIKLSQHVFEMHDIYCLTTSRITQCSQWFSQIPFQISSILCIYNYHTSAFITRSLYNFYSIFEGQKRFLRSFFHKILTRLVFKSSFKSKAGYSGAHTVF